MSRGAGVAGKAEARDDDDEEEEEDDDEEEEEEEKEEDEEEDEEEVVGYAYGVKLDVVPCMINPY